MLSLEALVVVIGWLVSLGVAILIVPKLAAKRICEQFGLTRVMVKGKAIYAVEDLEGNPVKIPIGTKDGDNGPEVVYGYAPLPMTLTFLAADQAAMRVKMTLNNAKSQVSKQLQKRAMGAIAAGEMTIEDAMASGVVPKNLQKLYAGAKLAQSLLGGLSPGNGSTAQNSPLGHASTAGGQK